MRTTNAQVRKLMEEMAKHGRLGLASARAGQVKELVAPARPEVPELAQPEVDLSSYDALLVEQREVAS
ncbi:hypothetical protein F0U61_51595 [Archangium violaceum]|uniref:hypothetical protein n=1 Tax=Archangium violaceum TaxID=83451 RepID=UPI002B28091C|nr:hypothetical protein F0U61_51595 [Archangium violaceum]